MKAMRKTIRLGTHGEQYGHGRRGQRPLHRRARHGDVPQLGVHGRR